MNVEQHYRQGLDPDQVLAAVDRHLGSNLAPEQLAPIDQLHLGGRRASSQLLEGVTLTADSRVLDVGCGLGGTSRLIAEQTGAQVYGLDLTGPFCRLAHQLGQRLEQPLPVRFIQGDALQLPFAVQSFDLIVSQHCLMNLPDPRGALCEFASKLRPGGQLVLHELLSGPAGDPFFPVPWASEPSQSHLIDEAELREWLDESGLQLTQWRELTEDALAWRNRHSAREQQGVGPLSPALIYGPVFKQLAANLQRSLMEQRVRVVHVRLSRIGESGQD